MRHSTAWQDSISLSFDESWPIGFYSRYSFPLYERKTFDVNNMSWKSICIFLSLWLFFFSPLCSRRRSTNLQPVAINAQIVCNVGTCGCDCITKHNEFYAKSPQFHLMPFRLSRAVASMLKSSFSSSCLFVCNIRYWLMTYCKCGRYIMIWCANTYEQRDFYMQKDTPWMESLFIFLICDTADCRVSFSETEDWPNIKYRTLLWIVYKMSEQLIGKWTESK